MSKPSEALLQARQLRNDCFTRKRNNEERIDRMEAENGVLTDALERLDGIIDRLQEMERAHGVDVTSGPGLAMLEAAWGLIENAGGGDWTTQSKEWQEAAARWRDGYTNFCSRLE